MTARRALILVEDLPVPFDRRVWSEAKTLRDAGWLVTVICPRGEGARRWHERIEGIEVFRYPLPTTAAGLASHLIEYAVAMPATLILSLLVALRGRIDVVHACNPPDFLFPIGWLLRRMGAAFVYDQHDLAPEVYVAQGGRRGSLLHRILLWCERATYRLADVVIATNETYKGFATGRGDVEAGRVVVVRSSPEADRLYAVAPRPELRDGRDYLLAYLGTMGPQDGLDLLIAAASEIERQMPGRVRFLAMGGGGQLEILRRQARAVDLEGALTFLGRVPDSVVREVLSTADVAISPDPANDFNEYCTMNKTLEYMAVGVPVVAFDLQETRVSAAEAALYATPNDPVDLARCVETLLADPGLRSRMATIGRERIAGPLSWEVSAANLLRAYDLATASRRALSPDSRPPEARAAG